MPKLPILSGRDLVKILEKTDYKIVRQKGSHLRLRHKNKKPITVPLHKELKPGLLHRILKDSDLNLEDL